MQITGQLSREEIMEAIAKGIQQGFTEALSNSVHADHELICNAIRAGVSEAISKMLYADFANDLLDAVKAGVIDAMSSRAVSTPHRLPLPGLRQS